jgi:hypothetical protein
VASTYFATRPVGRPHPLPPLRKEEGVVLCAGLSAIYHAIWRLPFAESSFSRHRSQRLRSRNGLCRFASHIVQIAAASHQGSAHIAHCRRLG